MIGSFGFVPARSDFVLGGTIGETMAWIAIHCRKVAEEHMAIAEKAEELMNSFLDNRHVRTGLRTFARLHRRAAWQYLEMARRAEAARRTGCQDFDLADVASV